jgi:hypothetical protein
MPKPSKNKPKSQSLTALAHSLDTRKRPPPPLPARGEGRGEGKAELPSSLKRDLAARLAQKPPAAGPPLKPGAPKPAPARPAPAPAKPAPVAARPQAPAITSVPRQAALASLQRSPSPAPRSVPTSAAAARSTMQLDARRQYPRADIQVSARLSLADDPTRYFEATLPTLNLSVGGMFLESSFFLKPGTRLLVELQLPGKSREVKVKAEVVRVETDVHGASGFALRFTEYLDGSQVMLATHFLSPVLRQFLTDYAQEHRFQVSPEYLAHTADVLAAWELKKAELGGDVWGLTGKQDA